MGIDSAPLRPPTIVLAPRSLRALIGPKPKVIDNDVWAKLLWAGLNLEECDLTRNGHGKHFYPVPMVKALTIVWLFGGLRSDEIHRLRVGCTRENWNTFAESSPPPEVCNLDVPVSDAKPPCPGGRSMLPVSVPSNLSPFFKKTVLAPVKKRTVETPPIDTDGMLLVMTN